MKSPPEKPSPRKGPRRRPYRPPVLVEYGSIAARTLASQVASFPDTMQQMTMVCY